MSDDKSRITLRATEWTVSATEKVSTGDYENYQPHATLKGEIPVAEGELDADTRTELKARLLALHADLQQVVRRAGENRIRAEGHEDWSVHGDDTVDPETVEEADDE